MSLSFSDRLANEIMRNEFPILVIFVYRDKVLYRFDENARLLAKFTDTAFLKAFVAFKSSSGREELFVNNLVANQNLSVFFDKTAASRSDFSNFRK